MRLAKFEMFGNRVKWHLFSVNDSDEAQLPMSPSGCEEGCSLIVGLLEIWSNVALDICIVCFQSPDRIIIFTQQLIFHCFYFFYMKPCEL